MQPDEQSIPRPDRSFLAITGVIGLLLVLGILWIAAAAVRPPSSEDQCAQQVSERVGGWICPGENP